MRTLERITVTGYKSIRELRDFELGDLNVLIGANGAGKSNFLSVFKLLEGIWQIIACSYLLGKWRGRLLITFWGENNREIEISFIS